MNWELVWDIRQASSADFLPFVALGGVLLVAALVFHLLARRKQARSPTARVLAVFGLLIAALGYGINSWDRNRLTGQLERGEVQVVEGFVAGHQVWRQQRPRSGNESLRFDTWETIHVGGVQFTWAPDAQEPAFTNRAPHKVAFRDGLPARLHWVEDIEGEAHQRRIVRLEIAAGYRDAPLADAPYPSIATPEQAGLREGQLPDAPFPSIATPEQAGLREAPLPDAPYPSIATPQQDAPEP